MTINYIKKLFLYNYLIDLHVHLNNSYDSRFLLDSFINESSKRNIDGACVVTHHTFNDRINYKSGKVTVFPGIEVLSNCGELIVIGYYNPVKMFASAMRIINEVHLNGGIIIIPHPFRGKKGIGNSNITSNMLEKIFSKADAVEVVNGNASKEENKEAYNLAKKLKKTMIGGSDAHDEKSFGKTAALFSKKINSLKDLIYAIKKGQCKPVLI